ncbi:hypothetical protein GQR58_022661 [Nymphon striatum]|nr:hypothetical protein GQR58_022661 [Nymphon striatum]
MLFGQMNRNLLMPSVKYGGGSAIILAAITWFSAGPIIILKEKVIAPFNKFTKYPQFNFKQNVENVSSKVNITSCPQVLKSSPNITYADLSVEKLLKMKEEIELQLAKINKLNVATSKPDNTVHDVCSEEYLGNRIGHPYYVDGYRNVKCNNSKPLQEVISIVLLLTDTTKFIEDNILNVLKGIKSTYPSLKIHLVVTKNVEEIVIKANNSNIFKLKLPSNIKEGNALKNVLKSVDTPYVLIARDLFTFHWYANLERQIRILSQSKNMAVVSGALRNSSAYWKHGCYQSETRMHVLQYTEGYYESSNECLYCDMVTGPFVVKRNIFDTVPMDKSLASEMLYKDWFLTLKSKGYKVMSCPDVMYFMDDYKYMSVLHDKKSWSPLATKWEFDYVKIDSKITHKFTCDEIMYKCKMMDTKNFILPTCCYDTMSHSLKFFAEFMQKHNISYEIDSGSVLGAIKLSDMMPWDLDGDIAMMNDDYQKVYDHKAEFIKAGLAPRAWRISKCCDKNGHFSPQGYFKIGDPLYFEVFGNKIPLSTDVYLPEELLGQHTKMVVHGITVNSQPNPGLFVRNRYGKECYKHSQSYAIYGAKSSFVPYKSGQFTKCSRPNYHTCLDMHPTDGSIYFKHFYSRPSSVSFTFKSSFYYQRMHDYVTGLWAIHTLEIWDYIQRLALCYWMVTCLQLDINFYSRPSSVSFTLNSSFYYQLMQHFVAGVMGDPYAEDMASYLSNTSCLKIRPTYSHTTENEEDLYQSTVSIKSVRREVHLQNIHVRAAIGKCLVTQVNAKMRYQWCKHRTKPELLTNGIMLFGQMTRLSHYSHYKTHLCLKDTISISVAYPVFSGSSSAPVSWLFHDLSVEKLLKMKEEIELQLAKINKLDVATSKPDNTVLEVCSEEYLGNRIGHPYYVDGYRNVKCSNSKPLQEVISIVLLLTDTTKFIEDNILNVLKGIKSTYPSLKIHLVVTKNVEDIVLKANNSNIFKLELPPNIKEGSALEKVLKFLDTPYVLIARDLFTFHWYANLERQIRILSQSKNMAVVSGALRNSSAYWKHGCYQSETRMHVLQYTEGYYESSNECLYCDMVTGPFVVKRNIFDTVPIDKSLASEMLYKDWFLTLKSKGYKVMSCPDVMYFMDDYKYMSVLHDKKSWSPLAIKWEFDYVKIDSKITHKFTCDEIRYKCNMMDTKNFILPTCCYDTMSHSLKFFAEFMQKNNISYEIVGGLVLGAIKLSDMMPWDLDGDLLMVNDYYQMVYNYKAEFIKAGLAPRDWRISKCCDKNGDFSPQGYFKIGDPLYFEVFGHEITSSTNVNLPEELLGQHTKMVVHGITVNSQPNPDIFKEVFPMAPNRLGHWLVLYTGTSSWEHHVSNQDPGGYDTDRSRHKNDINTREQND